MILKKSFLILLLSATSIAWAQDHHFSQFYATPLNTNPANTGNFAEDWRFSGIHRNQWSGINSAFVSSAFGFETNFKGSFIGQDKLGVGIMFLKDNVGANSFSNSGFLLSTAWHRKVDHQKRHKVSAGIQGGIIQKQLSDNGLQFENQYQNFAFNPDLANGETLKGSSQSYIDIEAGLGWSYLLNARTTVNSGISLYQLTSPQENFSETVDSLFTPNNLGNRLSFTVGAAYNLGNGMTLYPRILWMGQTKARNFNVGSSLGYDIGKSNDISVLVGLYTRLGDAAIVMGGMKYKNITGRISYDATYSGLNNIKGADGAGNTVGAWEVSLIIVGRFRSEEQSKFTVPCGIF